MEREKSETAIAEPEPEEEVHKCGLREVIVEEHADSEDSSPEE